MTSHNVGDWLQYATKTLRANHIQTARLDAQLLLEHALGQNRAWILAHTDTLISDEQFVQLSELLLKRTNGLSLAYIVGQKEFYGRSFRITSNVLVPRPESESFIELLGTLPIRPGQSLIDIGTGSGCLAVTAALEFPDLHVTAVDISTAALAIAKQNAKNHNAKVSFQTADLFGSITTTYDLILANLPYVPRDFDVSHEVRHEPDIAVFADQEGLELIEKLAPQASQHLNDGGYIMLESLKMQHAQVTAMYQKTGFRLVRSAGLVQIFQKV